MSNGFLSQDEINSLLNGELNNDNEVENNEELLRNYACLLKQIDTNYKTKKDFEEEIKSRFNEGKFN